MRLRSCYVVSWLAGCLTAASAAPVATDPLAQCPGYTAYNVQQSPNGMTASLKLAGNPCNVYGDDLTDLTLTVEYETGSVHLWMTASIS
jgi:alpha-glucosidase